MKLVSFNELTKRNKILMLVIGVALAIVIMVIASMFMLNNSVHKNMELMGKFATMEELQAAFPKGLTETAYAEVGDKQYVYRDNNWVTAEELTNPDEAYALALAKGYTGTYEEWLREKQEAEQKAKDAENLKIITGLQNELSSLKEQLKSTTDNGEIDDLQNQIKSVTDQLSGLQAQPGAKGADGENGIDGQNGLDGANGSNGQDGSDGLNGRDGVNGVDGSDGVNGKDGQNGINGINGKDGKDGKDGQSGITPTISDATKTWLIGTKDTGILAEGTTPHIDDTTKHWFIGDTDTGILAEGTDGKDAYQMYSEKCTADGTTPLSKDDWLLSLSPFEYAKATNPNIQTVADYQESLTAYGIYKYSLPDPSTALSKTDWLASLKGVKGDTGAKGVDG